MRLDKYLANAGTFGSRKDVKVRLRKKVVTVNDEVVTDGSTHINPAQDIVKVENQIVAYEQYIYVMLHKPPGYISATEDGYHKTVIDLLPAKLQHFAPFPVGRLDIDTEGLLLLTNDGKLAHQLTSPKKNVEKKYVAKIEGVVTQEDVKSFAKGVKLDDGYETRPAKLTINSAGTVSEIEVTITEGKFHQVKRMFLAVGKKVIYLKRVSMGKIELDPNLRLGEHRPLTEEEYQYCQSLFDRR
ncbi:pseudouridine synthase [Virgibacillus soli]|uniref:pseudouridine synthase n=1 Tax=Paracerasibacillus soli TaxID=480284 RepID=UPI0035F06DA9